MPTYKVLRAIEHNQKLYLPEVPDALPTTRSAGHGGEIPVDASGVIELSEREAAALEMGQIEPLKAAPQAREEPKGKRK